MKIRTLSIYTGKFADQIDFYSIVLGLPLIRQTGGSADFKIGDSVLKLIYKPGATPYHFAITIPPHKETEALQWLKQRVPILKHNDNEVINFESWNARSVYFHDRDNNIVELISRNNINRVHKEIFDQDQFLNISEIGMAVTDIADTYHEIISIKKIRIFDGDFYKFCAMGDENGLLIIIDKDKKKWFPANEPALSSDFKISGDLNFEFIKGHVKAITAQFSVVQLT